jgi:hypothetical protein
MTLRHRIDPLAIPPVKAARRIGLTLAEFDAKLPELFAAKFPPPNAAGTYSLAAIDRWLDPDAHPQASFNQTSPTRARDANDVVWGRLARSRGG